ncbi:hypothetical protein KDA_71890 [Dictyobacter alpinus]|uniref:Glycosyltransferase 2-like domain-containing protein n=1 Tax=Dictyobacter alpinus TaxID=2014873 RepID=A0A402BK37_9CHLR|nr:glycosyltransferase [Dictyobacter alpinus]GCE31705.1 hypothetical protein KDA_71890 [Dictyobacter alpinus]
MLDESDLVAGYNDWLSKHTSSSTSSTTSDSHEYREYSLRSVKIRGKDISTFAPFRHKLSAFKTITRSQIFLLLASIAIVVTAFIFFGMTLLVTIMALLMLFYLGDLALSFFLALQTFRHSAEEHIEDEIVHVLSDARWPMYTILCPLYKEARIVPQFVDAMQKLDYPVEKLQILFLTEQDDSETRDAINILNLPAHFKIVTVPEGYPRTKPRACNFGLLLAKGDYVVIYDAEDIPDPLQLKKAVLTFANLGPDIACVQAKLNFYNPRQNILTRWFTAEYSLWFDLTLPGLQRLGLPLPLGGTSNHFRIELLRTLGAWDPFNVTEDCDLGLRLGRYGLKTAMLNSTTYEEATSNVKNWIRQRSRWIKGYMQTYLVYMRQPLRYFRPGHFSEFLSLQLVIGGKTAVLFINPLMWLLLFIYVFWHTQVGPVYRELFPPVLLYIGTISLIFGNFFYIYSHMAGCFKRDEHTLIKWTLLIPVYWLLNSIAGFYALYQLILKPHYWEKTQHGFHLAELKPVSATTVVGVVQVTDLDDTALTTLVSTDQSTQA